MIISDLQVLESQSRIFTNVAKKSANTIPENNNMALKTILQMCHLKLNEYSCGINDKTNSLHTAENLKLCMNLKLHWF